MKIGLRVQLILAIIAAAVLPIFISGVIVGLRTYRVELEGAVDSEHHLAQRVQIAIDSTLVGVEDKLKYVAQILITGSPVITQKQQYLRQLIQNDSMIDELILLDLQGQMLLHTTRSLNQPSDVEKNMSQADEFIMVKANHKTYFSPVQFDEATGDPLMNVAVPIINPKTGQSEAILIAHTRIKKVWEFIKNIPLQQGENVYLVDSLNRVIAHQNPSVVLQQTFFTVPKIDGINIGVEKNQVILSSIPVQMGDEQLIVVAEKSVPLALSLTTTFLQSILIALGISALFTIIWGYFIVRSITKPIEDLAKAARDISKSNVFTQIKITNQNEIGDLVRTFNEMSVSLEKSRQNLENKVLDRTWELQTTKDQLEAKLTELEKMNGLMVGRELKMLELKKELESIKNPV